MDAPSAAAAAAAATAAGITAAQGKTMTVSTVSKDARAKSPIVSLANQVNAITTAKTKKNKHGELVAAVKSKEPRICKGVRVFSTKSTLISYVKQGDPPYEIVANKGKGFRFYGEVIKSAPKKGWWYVAYDLFPSGEKTLKLQRSSVTTIPMGQEEPPYDPRHEKVNAAVANMEMLVSEPEEDFDIALLDSDDNDDEEETGDAASNNKKKKKKKKTRKVVGIQSFLNMSDQAVLDATTYDHYYGEGDGDYIRWDILKEGEEITEDVMIHETDTSPFTVNIPWSIATSGTDCFDTFFKYFFPSLEGKAAVLDKYLSNPRCSGYQSYWVHEKVRFHREDKPDPDFIVSGIAALFRRVTTSFN